MDSKENEEKGSSNKGNPGSNGDGTVDSKVNEQKETSNGGGPGSNGNMTIDSNDNGEKGRDPSSNTDATMESAVSEQKGSSHAGGPGLDGDANMENNEEKGGPGSDGDAKMDSKNNEENESSDAGTLASNEPEPVEFHGLLGNLLRKEADGNFYIFCKNNKCNCWSPLLLLLQTAGPHVVQQVKTDLEAHLASLPPGTIEWKPSTDCIRWCIKQHSVGDGSDKALIDIFSDVSTDDILDRVLKHRCDTLGDPRAKELEGFFNTKKRSSSLASIDNPPPHLGFQQLQSFFPLAGLLPHAPSVSAAPASIGGQLPGSTIPPATSSKFPPGFLQSYVNSGLLASGSYVQSVDDVSRTRGHLLLTAMLPNSDGATVQKHVFPFNRESAMVTIARLPEATSSLQTLTTLSEQLDDILNSLGDEVEHFGEIQGDKLLRLFRPFMTHVLSTDTGPAKLYIDAVLLHDFLDGAFVNYGGLTNGQLDDMKSIMEHYQRNETTYADRDPLRLHLGR